MKDLVDHHYPEADAITLVVNNLNTHQKAALYEVFPPEEAKRIADKIDMHFTPKRGSWLNIAEIGLNVLYRQCLDRRISIIQQLGKEVKAWLTEAGSVSTHRQLGLQHQRCTHQAEAPLSRTLTWVNH